MVSGVPPLRDSHTRAPYFSCFSLSNMREHLAGQQFHALAGQFRRQRSRLTARQDDADAQLFLVLDKLLAHGRGTADEGKDAFFDVVPTLLLAEEGAAVLQDLKGG